MSSGQTIHFLRTFLLVECLLIGCISGNIHSGPKPVPIDGRDSGLVVFYSERDGNPEMDILNADRNDAVRLKNQSGNTCYPSRGCFRR